MAGVAVVAWDSARSRAKSRKVQGHSYPRFLRTVTVWTVLFAQAHLLWVAVLHRHEGFFGPAGELAPHRASLCVLARPTLHGPASDDATPFCAACQIIRHSALYPSVGIVADAPFESAVVAVQDLVCHLASIPPGTVYGRAPPIA